MRLLSPVFESDEDFDVDLDCEEDPDLDDWPDDLVADLPEEFLSCDTVALFLSDDEHSATLFTSDSRSGNREKIPD